jgi:hypothetical protein
MKNFYSILRFIPNKATEDSIAIGVVMAINNKVFSHFSDGRVGLASKLIRNNDVNVKFIANQIAKKIQNISNQSNGELSVNMNFINEAYFSYLNKYSNGLLSFSKPAYVSSDITESNYHQLIHYFFPEDKLQLKCKVDTTKSSITSIREKVDVKLIERVKDRVHTHFTFDEKNLDTIYFNFEIDCIGLNGAFIGAKTVDFQRSIQSIDREISHYFTLISSLSSKFKKPLDKNDFYIIAEEPQFEDSKIASLWQSVDKNQLVKIVHPEESEKIADLIIEKNAEKFKV